MGMFLKSLGLLEGLPTKEEWPTMTAGGKKLYAWHPAADEPEYLPKAEVTKHIQQLAAQKTKQAAIQKAFPSLGKAIQVALHPPTPGTYGALTHSDEIPWKASIAPTSPPTVTSGYQAGYTQPSTSSWGTQASSSHWLDPQPTAKPQTISLPLDPHTGALRPLSEAVIQQAMSLVSVGETDSVQPIQSEAVEDLSWNEDDDLDDDATEDLFESEVEDESV